MKTVQFPRGASEQEDGIIGADGQVRVDTTRKEIRLHDGVTQGGTRIPNYETVRQLIAAGGDTTTVGIQVVNTVNDLAAIIPAANMVALLNLAGSEDMFVWQPGAAPDGGAITSTVEGHWQRLDGRMGFYVRLYRAGLINMQINGAQPVADQDITAWLDNGTVKLWDGDSYETATPALFALLLANIGNYAIGAVTLPDRLLATLVDETDLDTVTDSGWYRSTAGAANAPVAGVHAIEHRQLDSDDAVQFFYLHNNTNRDHYVRYQVAGVWGSWVLVEGIPPTRLGSTAATVTDANSANESGFYTVASTATNLPVAENGTIRVTKRSSTAMTQVFASTDANKIYARRMTGGAWQAWVATYPADGSVITGTIPRANVGITTISQAEAEAGVATTDRIFTAERVAQAITNLIGGALRTIRALTLVAGDILYATGAGVLARLAIGANGTVLTSNGSAPTWAAPTSVGPTLLTSQATTSGNAKDFTIPAGAKRVTVMLDGVSINASQGECGIQLGDSGGIETTGYASGGGGTSNNATLSVFSTPATTGGACTYSGCIVLTRMNATHTWISQGNISENDGTNRRSQSRGGGKTLSAELTTVRLMTGDTFDAGSVNVAWE